MSLPNLEYSVIAEDEFSRTFDRLEREARDGARELESLQQALKRVEQQAESAARAATKGVSSVSTSITGRLEGLVSKNLTGFIVGLGAREVARAAVDFATLGTRVERTSEAFVLLSGGSANAAAKLLAVQRASGGAIDNLTAMSIANKAAALGIATTTQELERVTRFATLTGRVLGLDTVAALDNVSAAAANLSYVRLDQMGIASSKVKDEIRAMGKELDDSKAFLEATLTVGERTFAALEGSSITAASGVEKLSAAYANFLASLSGSGSTIDFFANSLANAFNNLTPNTSSQQADKLLGDIDAFFQARQRGFAGLDQQTTDLRIAQQALEAYSQAAADGVPVTDELAQAILNAADAAFRGPVSDEQRNNLVDYIVQLNSLIEQWGNVAVSIDSATSALARFTGSPFGVSPRGFTIQLTGGAIGPRPETNSEAIARLIRAAQDARDKEAQALIGQSVIDKIKSDKEVVDAQFELARATTDTAGEIALYQGQLANLNLSEAKRIKIQTKIAGLQTRLASETERAGNKFIGTLNRMESAFGSALGAIGGIPGGPRTTVTELDKKLSAVGLYQNKPDEFLRRAEDLLVNQVPRKDVSADFIRQAVSASTGIDVSKLSQISGDLLFALLEQEFTSARLFGTEFGRTNLNKLIDQDAIAFGLRQQGQANLGQQFLSETFKSGELPGIFANAGGFAGQLEEQLNSSGFAQSVGGIFNSQLTSDSVLTQIERAAPSINSRLESAIVEGAEEGNVGARLISIYLAQMIAAGQEAN